MQSYLGVHLSERDFPILPGKKAKHQTATNQDLRLNFGDIIYQVPGMIMHYLDDQEALGWSWLPPKDFIDRVMKGGKISFTLTSLEYRTLNTECIGYLTKGVDHLAGKIVDTKGGDFNYENAAQAELGQPPKQFVERMAKILEAARLYDKDKSKEANAAITLAPASGYEHITIAKANPKKLSYREQFDVLQCHDERDAYSVYQTAQSLHFFAISNDAAVANVNLISKEKNGEALAKKIPEIFLKLGIKFDTNLKFPYLLVSGKNLAQLKYLGADITNLGDTPTLEEKIAVVTGYKPEKAILSSKYATRSVYERDAAKILEMIDAKPVAGNLEIDLSSKPDLYHKIGMAFGNIDRIIMKNNEMEVETKTPKIEVTFKQGDYRGNMVLAELIRDYLIQNGLGINSHSCQFGGTYLQFSHFPHPLDICKPINLAFQALIERLFANNFVYQLKDYLKSQEMKSAPASKPASSLLNEASFFAKNEPLPNVSSEQKETSVMAKKA